MMLINNIYARYLNNPRIITDSRKVDDGCFFVALKGTQTDGNRYVDEAIDRGAAVILTSEVKYDSDPKCIFVDDTLDTLQKLAAFHRSQFQIPLLAITGSNGKTTTKELVREVLNQKFKVHATKGNFNNHIGVPLTLLDMPLDTEFAIIEMGANHVGEIAALCNIAQPDYGLITNIGLAHLEGFGGVQGIRKGKRELFDFIEQHDGTFFLNQADAYLSTLPLKDSVIKFNHLSKVAGETPLLKFNLQGPAGEMEIQTNLFGDYNLSNISAAVTIGRFFGVEDESIARAVAQYVPSMNRSQIIQRAGITIVMDAYNANPTSMTASITGFIEQFDERVLVLGSMLELGEESEASHQSLLDWVRGYNWRELVLVGEEFRFFSHQENLHWFKTSKEAGDWLSAQNLSGAAMLLKGSRSISLEKIIESLSDN